jgi:hypothetical protein
MTLAVCCMWHTPLLELTDPGPDKTADVETAFAAARDFVRDDDPRTGPGGLPAVVHGARAACVSVVSPSRLAAERRRAS